MPWVAKRSSGDLTYGSLVKYKKRLLIYLEDGNLVDITYNWGFRVVPAGDELHSFKLGKPYKVWEFSEEDCFYKTSVLKAIQILAMRDE